MPENPKTLPLLLSTTALQKELNKPKDQRANLLVCAVVQQNTYDAGHIPESHLVTPAELVSGVKPAVGRLPELERLQALFSRIGLSKDSHVIVYDDEGGGWAGRLIWTLDVLGHTRYSYVDGGLVAWKDEGRLMATSDLAPVNESSNSSTNSLNLSSTVTDPITDYAAKLSISNTYRASIDEVIASIEHPETVIWDARSPEEYAGIKNTALRNGHIPGAVNLDWLDTMDKNNSLRLHPLPELESRLKSLGIDKNKEVITHCQTHHRSGLTYLIGKLLDLKIRGYDGSWSEWGNHPETPIETNLV